jgi:hypothetical protein
MKMVDDIKVEADKNIKVHSNKMHLFHLFGLQFKPGESTLRFYDQFRNLVIASLKKKGDTIMWQNNAILTEDEKLSPTFEELMLGIVLGLIDIRLPMHVCDSYHDADGKGKNLMDYKADILEKVPFFLSEIGLNPSVVSKFEEDPLARYDEQCFSASLLHFVINKTKVVLISYEITKFFT